MKNVKSLAKNMNIVKLFILFLILNETTNLTNLTDDSQFHSWVFCMYFISLDYPLLKLTKGNIHII